jgi:transposase
MPGPKAPSVPLSADERQELLTLIRAHTTPQHFSFRAHIILQLAEGYNAREVARHVGTSRVTVRRWRRHWLARHAYSVAARLHDAPRPGAPTTFSAEQWCPIMALACEPPEASERPSSHWTPREVAAEAIKRGSVAAISERHVGRVLKAGRSQTASEPLRAQSRAGRGGRGEHGRWEHPLPGGTGLARRG